MFAATPGGRGDLFNRANGGFRVRYARIVAAGRRLTTLPGSVSLPRDQGYRKLPNDGEDCRVTKSPMFTRNPFPHLAFLLTAFLFLAACATTPAPSARLELIDYTDDFAEVFDRTHGQEAPARIA